MRRSLYLVLGIILLFLCGVILYQFVAHNYGFMRKTEIHTISEGDMAHPHPSLSPQEVVDIQLKAMQANDNPDKDFGIRTAFNFASPENKSNSGPIDRFIEMVHNPEYASLLNFKQYGLDEVLMHGGMALQKVTLIDAKDQPAVYLFQLTKQTEAPYEECWMTDNVMKYR